MLNSNYFYIPLLMSFSTLIFPLMNEEIHPLNLMIILIIYSLSFSLLINFNNNIYPYILFLIMIGGMMIMFLYFTSLINNEKSKTSTFSIYSSILFIITFSMISFFKFNSKESLILINPYKNLNSNSMSIYSEHLTETTSFLIYFLFFSMVMVIKLCKSTNLPLRKLIYV
uniref:NADH dehydrogenase subunit 6 n=1 Tax=Diodontus polytylus TaxID=2555507 RepID=A0A5J6DR91_9HYME|nr:NADH dehydrogenase subunit 6 [Diodontus polytylus]